MHEIYLKKAIKLALKGEGHTAPNPKVGCILVKDGQIIAQGYHRAYGALHAEREALKNLSPQESQGATAYITLEPCSHYGQQPPCVDALIEAGLSHIVFPFCDGDKKVHGQGLAKLKQAGISVTLGLEVEKSFELIQDFMKHRLTQYPLVRAKWAMGLDGKIATYTGHSRWISSKKSREYTHELRHKSQGILIGAHTLRKDNPKLNVRLDSLNKPSHPIPIVMVGQNPIDCNAYIFQNPQTIIITGKAYKHALPPSITHIALKTNDKGLICPKDALRALGEQKIISILIDGGGSLLAPFIQQDLIDEYHVFIAPKLIGNSLAPTAFGGEGFAKITEAIQLKLLKQSQKEEDIYLYYESQKFHQWKKEQIACLQAL